MIKNDTVLFLFIVYSFYMPLVAFQGPYILERLTIFDWCFVLDRTVDLFVGYYNENGSLETSVFKVIHNNIAYTFFLELLISFGPCTAFDWFYESDDESKLPAELFFIFKVFRYVRMFELES